MTPKIEADDERLRAILTRTKTIAVVGASDDAARPSNGVLRFLVARGYDVVGVNPKLAGATVGGVAVYASLADVPGFVDMVDVFRAGSALPGVVAEVLALRRRPAVLWTQIGVRHDAAVATAAAAGLEVVVDRCPKIEIARLFG